MTVVARALLTAFLLLAAVSKLVRPDHDAVLSLLVQRLVALLELLGAAILWTPYAAVAASLVLVLSLAGAAFVLLRQQGAECGCFGSVVHLTQLQHLGLAAALSALACLLLANPPTHRGERVGKPPIAV